MGIVLINVHRCDGKHPTLPLDGSSSLMEFIADDVTDVTDLPTTDEYEEGGEKYGKAAKGSKASVLEDGSVYYLDSDGTWTKFGT